MSPWTSVDLNDGTLDLKAKGLKEQNMIKRGLNTDRCKQSIITKDLNMNVTENKQQGIK